MRNSAASGAIWLAASLAAMLVAACVGSTPHAGAVPASEFTPSASALAGVTARPEGSAIPWLAATPPPSPAPTSPGWPSGPDCVAGQLATTAYPGDGTTPPSFTVWNDGSVPCQLGRAVSVSLIDSRGRALQVTQTTTPLGPRCGGTGGQCPPPGPTAPPWILMPPSGGEASNGGEAGSLRWSNWCGALPAQPLSLVVTLGLGVVVRTSAFELAPPACTDAGKPSILDVTPLEIGGSWPTAPQSIAAEDLRVRLETPATVTAGSTLHYAIDLYNPTSSAILLLPCPTYQESLSSGSGRVVEEHVLNCAGVRQVPAGGQVRFEMELAVPASLPASSASGIVWQLDPWYSLGLPPTLPAAKGAITVVP